MLNEDLPSCFFHYVPTSSLKRWRVSAPLSRNCKLEKARKIRRGTSGIMHRRGSIKFAGCFFVTHGQRILRAVGYESQFPARTLPSRLLPTLRAFQTFRVPANLFVACTRMFTRNVVKADARRTVTGEEVDRIKNSSQVQEFFSSVEIPREIFEGSRHRDFADSSWIQRLFIISYVTVVYRNEW